MHLPALVTQLLGAIPYPLRPWTSRDIREYDLRITWEDGAPDGHMRKMFKINGQFPGPLLELNQGDEVAITVHNDSPFNTTIHYHGIQMMHTPWSDGVPGVSQNYIQPGCAFTYRWTATQHGSYFYHSHAQSQLQDGLYGPLVIHPRPGLPNPFHLITSDPKSLMAIERAEKDRRALLIGDWREITSDIEWAASLKSHIVHLCYDSFLVNGVGNVNCLSPDELKEYVSPNMAKLLSVIPGAGPTDKGCLPAEVIAKYVSPDADQPDLDAVPPGVFDGCRSADKPPFEVHVRRRPNDGDETWVMLDLIGAVGARSSIVSIDEVPVWVVALDGNYIEPVRADALPLFMGQRYTVLVKLTEPKKYTIRVSGPGDSQIIFGTAVLDFQIDGRNQSSEPSKPSIDILGRNMTSDVVYYDGLEATPYVTPTIPRAVDATYKLTMQSEGSQIIWALNSTARLEDKHMFNPPLLFSPRPDMQDNHTITIPSSHKWVDFIFMASGLEPEHPIHMHGRHFYVLGAGNGTFHWSSVQEAMEHLPEGTFNLRNPQLRDTYSSPSSMTNPAWLALRRPSDNQGAWLIHCHIQSHLQGGMAMVILDGIEEGMEIPQSYRERQCAV